MTYSELERHVRNEWSTGFYKSKMDLLVKLTMVEDITESFSDEEVLDCIEEVLGSM